MSDPRKASLKFLESLTRSYYRERARLEVPRDFVYREFAAQTWFSTSYIRHIAFTRESEIKEFAVSKAPRHFYYSSARYDQPGATDMDSKGWLGADIVFDIDADHLPECIDKTVNIEDKALGVKASFAPSECVRRAAIEALLLTDILVNELGFQTRDVRIEFSGHRGFHVIVNTMGNSEWERAGPDVRRELVNYVKAVDALEEAIRPTPPVRRKRFKLLEPSETDPGLSGRYARFRRILGEAEQLKLGVEVDEQVTVDVKRLIRIPGSLNGKTMLPVKPVRLSDLEDFTISTSDSPFADHGAVRVQAIVDTPAIEVLGHRVKLRRGARMKLDAPVALYLMAKGVAVLAQE